MKKKELKKKIKALGLEKGDERIPSIVCSLVGHSKIVNFCMGEVSCSRCRAVVGDTLMGLYDVTGHVIVGHNCEVCHENYDKLGWEDKYLCPDPFKE